MIVIVTTSAPSSPSSSFRRKPESSVLPLLPLEVQSFVPPTASRLLFGIAKKVTKKARHRTRCPAARHARRGVPVLLGAGGVVWQYVRVLSADARTSCARPCGHFPPPPAMLGTANGARIHESVHPCTISRCRSGKLSLSFWLWLLRQDAAETGPPVARRAHGGTARRVARRMRASSLNAQGRASSEPRSAFAHSQGRMPEERAIGGVFLWLPFFAQALRRRSGANSGAGRVAAKGRMPGVKKVTRSPTGRAEALHFEKRKSTRRWIPAFAGLRRQDAGANIREAAFNSGAGHGPKGEWRMQLAMTSTRCASAGSSQCAG